MPEKKLSSSAGKRMTTDELNIKSKWSNPDYERYEESLKQLILGKFKEVVLTFPHALYHGK